MNKVALLIGGNQGDRHTLIEQATVLIQERIGTVVLASNVYETEPWGKFDEAEQKPANFLNKALVVDTLLSPHDVLYEAQAIELSLGRVRSKGGNTSDRVYSSRPMDIDLIFFNDEVIDTPELTIPHPRMHLRRFVLEPLAEIIPEYQHPILRLSVAELLSNLPPVYN